MPSSIQKGSAYEKEIEERYKQEGWVTHRNIKSRFGIQDVLGVADVIATNTDNFILIACAVGRAQTKTVGKIKKLRPSLPKFITVLYYIKKSGKEEIREY